MNKKMDEITYFGMDHRKATGINTRLPVMDYSVRRWLRCAEDYIRPQENGSHYDCDYVDFTNGQCGIRVVSKNHFRLTLLFIHRRSWNGYHTIMN